MPLEVTDIPAATMPRKLLQGGTEQRVSGASERMQPSLAEVNKLKSFLQKLWNMDLRPKEYAYLKGAMLFNSDVSGLRAAPCIEGLQKEAYQALREVILLLHPSDHGCFPFSSSRLPRS
ncbi:hypothetical protein AAFF_G00175020 [Aldrovandia affinis]|uniref:NR LBD domain-containing protein n=1 Tax=Aldrovandia affinis TaxID=143900 RepID=A0AAD7W6R1_9TELE|nr:hypothetical protein AAFF_G00175020 [Aldrovandia affinis]